IALITEFVVILGLVCYCWGLNSELCATAGDFITCHSSLSTISDHSVFIVSDRSDSNTCHRVCAMDCNFGSTLVFHGLTFTPPTAMSSACRTDSSLKDASEIEWYNDAKDDSPIAPPPPTYNGTLNSFIHRSGRAVKPTEKIHETLAASTTSAKRSAPEPPQGVPAPKRVFIGTSSQEQDDDNDDDDDAPALEDVTDDEEEDAKNAENEEAYRQMKKLGDQDREDLQSLPLRKVASTPTPRSVKMGGGVSQASLDGSLIPKLPAFTKSGLMDYTVELIVTEDELGWFTADNASNNDTAIEMVARSIDPNGKEWKPIEHRVW
ncbi:hypothetical protein DFH29DRAFT_883076, partial [Suillus ampliporus]